MTSMTGYGSATVTTDEFQLEVEVKSYNNRYLDIDHTMPYYLASYEMDIDRRIGEVARRGHIELAVRVKQGAERRRLRFTDGRQVKYRVLRHRPAVRRKRPIAHTEEIAPVGGAHDAAKKPVRHVFAHSRAKRRVLAPAA